MMFSSEKKSSIAVVSSEEDADEDRQILSDECEEPDVKKRKVENDTPKRPPFSDIIDPTELRVIIVGKTGTGKSTTGNTILGRNEFRASLSASSITKACELAINTRFGRKIVVVDTPGLYDTHMTNEDVTKEIVKCIGMTAPGPHAILLTICIGRFTNEEIDTVKQLGDHFGIGIYNYLTVVFTKQDYLERNGLDIRDFVNNCPQALRALLKQCDHRYIPFDNTLSGYSQEQQVKNLISMIDENVQSKGGLCYTNETYEAAENTMQRLVKEERSKVQNIRYHLQDESNDRFTSADEETKTQGSERLLTEKQIAKSLEADRINKINALKNKLSKCEQQEKHRNRTEILRQEIDQKVCEDEERHRRQKETE